MQFHDFVGQVQSKAQMGTLDDAVHATRVTLQHLGRRLQDQERRHLASQLPEEIGHYLQEVQGEPEKFDAKEFFDRVSKEERRDLPESVYHARVVCDVLTNAISPGEVEHLKSQLPDDFIRVLESGSEGQLNL